MKEATWTDAYPLTWPAGWPRTAAGDRRNPRFKSRQSRMAGGNYVPPTDITIAVALDRIRDELVKMGVDWDRVVVSTNIETRRDGLPRSDRGNPSDPGVAVYWFDPENGTKQQCMAIDLYDTVAGNLAAVAATLDAMRAIERHGGAQILKRAFQGFKALPASTTAALSTETAAQAIARRMNGSDPSAIEQHADLIATDADYARQAIRRAANKVHPDRGGSVEDFQLVQEAKRVLAAHHGSDL